MSKIKTDQLALDSLVENYDSFIIEDRKGQKKTLHLYPLQLGRLALISKRIIELDVIFDKEDTDVVQQLWKICAEKPRQVAEIIAIATLRTKEEIDGMLQERTEDILWSPTMTQQTYSNLLFTIFLQSYYADFLKAIRSVRMLRVSLSQQTEAERIAHTEGGAAGDR